MLPDYGRTADALMPFVLDDEEALVYNQKSLEKFVSHISSAVYNNIYASGLYPDKRDKIRGFRFVLDVFKLLYGDGVYPMQIYQVNMFCTMLAGFYAEEGEAAKAFECLTEALNNCVKYKNCADNNFKGPNASFLLNKVMYDNYNDYSGCTVKDNFESLLYSLKKPSFDALRNDPRFAELEEALKRHTLPA